MMSKPVDPLSPLTGLRGVAAYSVLLAHAMETFFVYQTGPTVFHLLAFRLAYFGMSLFFVLSGFVLFYTYGSRIADAGQSIGQTSYNFFVARFARLYPLYIIGLVVFSPHGMPSVFKHHLALKLSYVSLTQSWFNWEVAFFPPDWSISTEWFFYFAFIPLSMLVSRVRRPILALVAYCAAAGLGVSLLLLEFGPQLEMLVQRWLFLDSTISAPARWWLVYLDPPLRLLEFVAGMLAANAYLSRRSRSGSPLAVSAVLGVALAYCLFLLVFGDFPGVQPLFKDILPNIAFAPALSAFLLCIGLSRGWCHRLLSSRPLLFMGEISYSVYMWSFLVLRLFPPMPLRPDFSFRDALPALSDIACDVALTTLLAYGSYRLIEVPSRDWLRATMFARRRREPSPRLESWQPVSTPAAVPETSR